MTSDAINHPSAFLTGSRAYGIPREDSDIDIVVMVNINEVPLEATVADGCDYEPESVCLRYGPINLIACVDPAVFDVWKRGTEELIARRPVTRQEAIDHLESLKAELKARRKAEKAMAEAT
jgi:hypothetical protein